MYRNFGLKTLEREYSPSSCVDDIDVYVAQYITLSASAKNTAIEQKKLVTDIQYGSKDDEVLDMFLPFDSSLKQRKLQVYIHGGYWQELSKNESSFAATNFQQLGYHFAVLNYSLAPNASLTEIVEQNRQALKFLYQNAEKYGYDKSEIYLSGSSAGGHLAMMMALTDWLKYIETDKNIIKGICAVSGIYDLTPIAQTYINEPLQLSEKEIATYSPLLLNVDRGNFNNCPIIIAYGENETSEFKRQTLAMKSHLEKEGLEASFSEIKNRNHFDVILDLAEPQSWLSQEVFKQMQT